MACLMLGLSMAMLPSVLVANQSSIWIGQKTATDCGRAALAMLAVLLTGRAPADVYRQIPDPADRAHGYSLIELVSVASKLSIDLDIAQQGGRAGLTVIGDCRRLPTARSQFAALLDAVKHKGPAIVPTRNRDGTNHYLVVFAVDESRLMVLDPARQDRAGIHIEDFRAMTCPFGHIALSPRISMD